MFEHESRAVIAKRIVEDRFLGCHATEQTMQEMAAFLKQTLLALEKDNLPPRR
jgi:hypothetical protein